MHYYTVSNDNELYHYGVLGMKWGVRKGRVDAVKAKATKKLLKLDNKATKAQKKAIKARYSLLTKLFGQERYLKKQAKADERLNKAADWYDSMESVLGKTLVSDITNSRSVNLSQKYSGYLESLRPDTLRTMNNAYQAMNSDEVWRGRY